MNDQSDYRQVSDSIKMIFDLTSRIDERVKILVEQHAEANQRIERLMERHENLLSRISVLENGNGTVMREAFAEIQKDHQNLLYRMNALEIQSAGHASKWQHVGDFIFKVSVALVGGFLAYKLGLSK